MLVRTETAGGPTGPLFFGKEIFIMSKPFLTYDKQIENLIKKKHLQVPDLDFAKSVLKDIGYFSLIGGYKTPFINPMTRIYEKDTTFEDILALYHFDLALRELIFKYLCQFECKIRQQLSYAFCNKYGEQESAYLNPNHFNLTSKNSSDISYLIRTLSYNAKSSKTHPYVIHQRNIHHNVPLWVLVNTLTYGQISKFYTLLPSQLQSEISKEFPDVNEKNLEKYLRILTLFRNVCAHNERLYCFRLQIDFPNTTLHKKLNLPKKGDQYLLGKRDLFGLMIAFRYLLSQQDFLQLKRSFIHVLNQYTKSSHSIDMLRLLNMMGFPPNWKDITKYHIPS